MRDKKHDSNTTYVMSKFLQCLFIFSISGFSVDGSEGFQDSDVSFRIVDQSRYPEILKLLYINFHTDEPMSRALGIIEDKDLRIPVLDKFALDGLKQVLQC